MPLRALQPRQLFLELVGTAPCQWNRGHDRETLLRKNDAAAGQFRRRRVME
jgi:hypothetical protein